MKCVKLAVVYIGARLKVPPGGGGIFETRMNMPLHDGPRVIIPGYTGEGYVNKRVK